MYFRLERRGIARRPRAPRHGVRPADAELAHLYWDCGLSLRDLAGRYGVSRRAVHNWPIAAGIDRRPQRTAPAVCDGDDPVALYRAGWSAPAIAERVGGARRPPSTGVSTPPVCRAGRCVRVSRHDLIEALDQGPSAPDTAAALGVSVSCVCRARAREQLLTTIQAARQRRRLRFAELYRRATPPTAKVSVSGNVQR
ncbi:MAG: hypothetical protein ACRDZS_09905 [Acidimicrobiales bacterium]